MKAGDRILILREQSFESWCYILLASFRATFLNLCTVVVSVSFQMYNHLIKDYVRASSQTTTREVSASAGYTSLKRVKCLLANKDVSTGGKKNTIVTYVTTNVTLPWRYFLPGPLCMSGPQRDPGSPGRPAPRRVQPRSPCFLPLSWEPHRLFESTWVMTVNKCFINLPPYFFLTR